MLKIQLDVVFVLDGLEQSDLGRERFAVCLNILPVMTSSRLETHCAMKSVRTDDGDVVTLRYRVTIIRSCFMSLDDSIFEPSVHLLKVVNNATQQQLEERQMTGKLGLKQPWELVRKERGK